MKKIICFAILFFSYVAVFSQTSSKEKRIQEIKPVSDTTLHYPLRGVIQTHMIYGILNMIAVEYSIYDAQGNLIYENAENYRASTGVTTMDEGYMHYMALQGNYFMQRKGYTSQVAMGH